jgi:hypothetical protein
MSEIRARQASNEKGKTQDSPAIHRLSLFLLTFKAWSLGFEAGSGDWRKKAGERQAH